MSEDVAARIAALIAGATGGGQPPAWLIANLPALIDMVRAAPPTRRRRARDLREALETVERTAGKLADAPNDPAVMDHLARVDPSVLPSGWIELLASAPEIAKRAGLALELVPEGRDGMGAGPPALPSRMRCAAIVSEAWQAVRDRREVPNADDACRAAALLWRAAGRASPGETHAAARWRRSFAELRTAETDHPEAFAIIRAALAARPGDTSAIET